MASTAFGDENDSNDDDDDEAQKEDEQKTRRSKAKGKEEKRLSSIQWRSLTTALLFRIFKTTTIWTTR